MLIYNLYLIQTLKTFGLQNKSRYENRQQTAHKMFTTIINTANVYHWGINYHTSVVIQQQSECGKNQDQMLHVIDFGFTDLKTKPSLDKRVTNVLPSTDFNPYKEQKCRIH